MTHALILDHCIEVLRQGVMCRGDISLVTIRWQEHFKLPVADFTAPHECVNFDALNEWARERRINAMEPGLLVHPTLGKHPRQTSPAAADPALGPSYPEGSNPTLGAAESTENFIKSPVTDG